MGEQAVVIKPIVQLPWIAVHFVEFEVFCQTTNIKSAHETLCARVRVYDKAGIRDSYQGESMSLGHRPRTGTRRT